LIPNHGARFWSNDEIRVELRDFKSDMARMHRINDTIEAEREISARGLRSYMLLITLSETPS